MTPTKEGRICSQCSKTIIDFSKLQWSDIERIQKQNNYSVCGMYSSRQLNNWGEQTKVSSYLRFGFVATLLISMGAVSPSFSQTNTKSGSKVIIHGIVTGRTSNGAIDTLPFATIELKGTEIGTRADKDGNYQLDIADYIDTIQDPIIVIHTIGFLPFKLDLKNIHNKDIRFDAVLNSDPTIMQTAFYVNYRPSLGQRIKRKVRKLLRRNN